MSEIARFLHLPAWPPQPDLLFWVALTLTVGALLGEFVNRWRGLPRIVGYSAAGMALALSHLGFADGVLDEPVRLAVDVALSLLLFELGSRVDLGWLRANPMLLVTSLAESLAAPAGAFAALRWLGLDFNVALTCAVLTMCASGAVASRVSAELKSAGQVTERMTMLTSLNTLYAVLALKLTIGWLHLDARGDWVQGIAQPLYTFAGSVLVAALLARALAVVMARLELRDENTVLLVLGGVLLAMTVTRLLGLSTILVPLLAGVLLRNLDGRPCVWPRHFGTAGGVLVLLLFVAVGAAWSPTAVAGGLAGGLALMAGRSLARGGVLVVTAPLSGLNLRQGVALALTTTPVSVTTLVLLADLRLAHDAFAASLAPIVLLTTAAMALPGPMLVQWGLRLAGEARPRGGRGA